jgi:ribosomal protein S18
MVRGLIVDPAGAMADVNFSVARKSASSAWKKLTTSTIRIVPRRLTGVCTPHQRRLTSAIKRARNIALLPFAAR